MTGISIARESRIPHLEGIAEMERINEIYPLSSIIGIDASGVLDPSWALHEWRKKSYIAIMVWLMEWKSKHTHKYPWALHPKLFSVQPKLYLLSSLLFHALQESAWIIRGYFHFQLLHSSQHWFHWMELSIILYDWSVFYLTCSGPPGRLSVISWVVYRHLTMSAANPCTIIPWTGEIISFTLNSPLACNEKESIFTHWVSLRDALN